MNIRLAKSDDSENIIDMYKEAVDDLLNVKNIDILWDDEYPFCYIKDDILDCRLYIMIVDDKIVGGFVIEKEVDPNYKKLEWINNDNFFYISRLVVKPSEQGKGYANFMLKFVENYAVNNGFSSIRLGVADVNKSVIKLYEKFNFKRVNGYIEWDGNIFWGYERLI